MKKPIKKLTKDLIEEGITLDLINSIDLSKKCSPVMIAKGDEPVRLLICSTGYNVIVDDGTILRDAANKPIVLPEKECVIGRARYLVNYGEQEKATQVKSLAESWRSTVRSFLDQIKKKVEGIERSLQEETAGSIPNFIKILSRENWPAVKAKLEAELSSLKPAYQEAEDMFAKNKIIELLSTCGLKEFSNPMLSVKLDNPKEMKMLLNTFGGPALQKWDGDMLTKYAEIEVEKSWPN